MVLKNQCFCDRCCVTEAKMLKADVMAQVVHNHSVCNRRYVTKALMFGLLLEPKLKWIHQYFISYVWQLVFAYISIKGWDINSEEHGFLDGSYLILIFSAHNAKIVIRNIITSGVMMVIDGWWGFHVLFKSFCKCSAWLPSIFFLTVHSVTLVSVYHPIFLQYCISILGFY